MATHHTPGTVRLRVHLPAGWLAVTTTDGDDTNVDIEPLNDDEATLSLLGSIREELRSSGPGDHELSVMVPDHKPRLLWFGNE
jgi:hypothetical protein